MAYSAAWDASQEKLPINGVEGVELAWPYGCLESAEQANEIKTVVQVQAICQGIRSAAAAGSGLPGRVPAV